MRQPRIPPESVRKRKTAVQTATEVHWGVGDGVSYGLSGLRDVRMSRHEKGREQEDAYTKTQSQS